MKKSLYTRIVSDLPDNELYQLAKKYIVDAGLGFLHNSWRSDIIFQECLRRQSDIYQKASEDAINIINNFEDAIQGLKAIDSRQMLSMTDEEVSQFFHELNTQVSNPIDQLSGAERKDIFKILGIKERNLLVCRVNGTSMINADINEGDIIIVDTAASASHDKIIVAAINDELFIKKLKIKGSIFYLVSENESLQAIEITDDLKFNVVGVVKYIFHKL